MKNKKLDSVPSAGTEAQQSDAAEATTSSRHIAKRFVGCSLCFAHEKLKKIKKMVELITYVFSKDCPPETKRLVYSHALAILVSVAALVVSLMAFFRA